MWYHQGHQFCAIGLTKHRDEMIFSRTSREPVAQLNIQLNCPESLHRTIIFFSLSPSANRDTTDTARASTAPAHTFAGIRHRFSCHVPGHLRYAEKFISFQAHNCFYVRLITLLHLHAKFRIKLPNSFLYVSLNEVSHTGHLNQHRLCLFPVLS